MKTLKQVIQESEAKDQAVGHFNISDLAAMWAIFNAARDLDLPILIGTSEGERKFVGPRQAVALVKSLREEFDYPIYINADHTYSFEGVKQAVDSGYDSVIFDGAKLPLEENIKITKQCVEYAKSKDPDIVVEGELGYIGSSSKLLDEIPEGAQVTAEHMTSPEEAAQFVKETGVDLLAPAVGNLHGMFKNAPNPNIDAERVTAIRNTAGVPLVLHGGSGITDEDIRAGVKAGIAVAHVNTEIRVAWREGMEQALKEKPDEIAPYKLFPEAVMSVQKVVEHHLKLFAGK